MKIKCIIVDDEPIAIKLIKRHLGNFQNIEVIGECKNAIQANEMLHKEKVDLMFLDIQMPQISGIDFLKSLSKPPKVIITTAHRNYAIEGYEFDVVDFLLKPISLERFFKAMNKYFELESKDSIELKHSKSRIKDDLFIYVKENRKVQKVFLIEIIYIESLKEYIRIYTKDRKIITKLSLANIEKKLPEDNFIRVHKSFIVNIDKIKAFSSRNIEIGNIEIPISRSYKQSVFKMLECDNDLI